MLQKDTNTNEAQSNKKSLRQMFFAGGNEDLL